MSDFPTPEDPDEVVYHLQGRSSSLRGSVWSTLASGTAKEIESQRRRWIRGDEQKHYGVAGGAYGQIDELRILRVELHFGPVIRLGATIAGQADVAGRERRTSPPSEQPE